MSHDTARPLSDLHGFATTKNARFHSNPHSKVFLFLLRTPVPSPSYSLILCIRNTGISSLNNATTVSAPSRTSSLSSCSNAWNNFFFSFSTDHSRIRRNDRPRSRRFRHASRAFLYVYWKSEKYFGIPCFITVVLEKCLRLRRVQPATYCARCDFVLRCVAIYNWIVRENYTDVADQCIYSSGIYSPSNDRLANSLATNGIHRGTRRLLNRSTQPLLDPECHTYHTPRNSSFSSSLRFHFLSNDRV